MPELPEVETVRTGLAMSLKGAMIGKVTLRRKNLRIPFPPEMAKTLAGHTIADIKRRAKYLLFEFDSDEILIAHLGMSGRFSIEQKPPKAFSTHDHAVFHLTDGRVLVFNDARRFGLMTLTTKRALSTHPLFAALGPEPLEKSFSAAYLQKRLLRSRSPIKTMLMDQSVVVGVGNIYASEALFLAGIDPRKPAADVAPRAKEIIAAIRTVLNAAIASGGSSLRDFFHITGNTGYFQHRFQVYDRKGEPCFSCGTPIRSIRQSGRSTFFCESCQI